jgi:hypothetical protein
VDNYGGFSLVEGALLDDLGEDAFRLPPDSLQESRLVALNERLNVDRPRIAALDRLALESGVTQIANLADVIPLLFSHTTYKSYPESLVRNRSWDALAGWMDLFSSRPDAKKVDFTGVETIDEWIARAGHNGHFVYASSGTTGKCSLMNQSREDLDFIRKLRIQNMTWATGAVPTQSRPMFFPTPPQPSHQVGRVFEMYATAFGRPNDIHWLTETPLLVDDINRAGAVRRSLSEGTAVPSQLADQQSAKRANKEQVDNAFRKMAQLIQERSDEPVMICGTWGQHWRLSQELVESGASRLHRDSVISTGGGLKGLVVPEDYMERIERQYGVDRRHWYRQYGCTEINSHMVGCTAGRFHVPPWVVPIILDKNGERLAPLSGSTLEGRMAFFDFGVRGRWGGVITGDKVRMHLDPCPCGLASASISTVERYANLAEGEEKLSCAGTMEAYVRGEFGV